MISNEEKLFKSLQNEYPEGMCEITDLSRNTSSERDFIRCDHMAFNFDLVVNPCGRRAKEKTPDALLARNSRLYFVEFKEGVESPDRSDIRLKIYEGLNTLYQFSVKKEVLTRNEFFGLDVTYVVVRRLNLKGQPRSEVLDTLETSADFFDLKNMDGFVLKKVAVIFRPKTILDRLSKMTDGAVKEFDYVEVDGEVRRIS